MELVLVDKDDGTVDGSRRPIPVTNAFPAHEVLVPYAENEGRRDMLYNGELSNQELSSLGRSGRLRYGDGSAAGQFVRLR